MVRRGGELVFVMSVEVVEVMNIVTVIENGCGRY